LKAWNRHIVRALAAAAMLALAGCGRSVPQLPALARSDVILAFGDSLTYGTGAGKAHSYPAVLTRLTGHRVVNAGVPGELSAAGAARLPGVLDRIRPALIVLCHGGNDLLQHRNEQATAAHLRAMVEAARDRGIPVVLLGVPRPRLFGREPPAFYPAIARRFDLPYDGNTLATLEGEASLKADAVHFNAEGYRRLARAVYRLIRQTGAL